MIVDPNDIILAGIVVFLFGFCGGALWYHVCNKPTRDSRGRFMKR